MAFTPFGWCFLNFLFVGLSAYKKGTRTRFAADLNNVLLNSIIPMIVLCLSRPFADSSQEWNSGSGRWLRVTSWVLVCLCNKQLYWILALLCSRLALRDGFCFQLPLICGKSCVYFCNSFYPLLSKSRNLLHLLLKTNSLKLLAYFCTPVI
jgi:hypothetical protein